MDQPYDRSRSFGRRLWQLWRRTFRNSVSPEAPSLGAASREADVYQEWNPLLEKQLRIDWSKETDRHREALRQGYRYEGN